jgi:hypothetical protein
MLVNIEPQRFYKGFRSSPFNLNPKPYATGCTRGSGRTAVPRKKLSERSAKEKELDGYIKQFGYATHFLLRLCAEATGYLSQGVKLLSEGGENGRKARSGDR